MILLDKENILNNIDITTFKHHPELYIFEKIDSTNSFLKSLIATNSGPGVKICCAEQQTAGRGRHAKSWYSPFGENIYLSISWEFTKQINQLSQLSLVVGISVLEVIKEFVYSPDFKLKWPNDIYYKSQKVAGILTEIISTNSSQICVIVGVGINVNIDFKTVELTNYNAHELQNYSNWTSLFAISKQKFNRNILISQLITKINANIQTFITSGFNVFVNIWNKYDYLNNKSITINYNNSKLTGVCAGIDEIGRLKLTTSDQNIIHINSGEIIFIHNSTL